jgi:hypothetical protein
MPTTVRFLLGLIIIASVILTPVAGILGPFAENAPPSETREYFLPAGYTFSVWGIIYGGLIAFGVWFLLPQQAQNPRALRVAPWLAVSALFNVFWMYFAGSPATIPLTVPALLVMQVTAWVAYWHWGVLRNVDTPRGERWLQIPLRVYVGWLSVATVANSATALNVLHWDGFGISPVAWTVTMLIVATVVAGVVGWLVGNDNIYRAVFVHAFIGIAIGQQDTPVVAETAGAMAIVVGLMILATTIRKPHRRWIVGTAEASPGT